MAQRHVEILIGRLITDEAFRMAFVEDPASALARFIESGHDLTVLEMAALSATDARVWAQAADEIDPRLQKVAFSGDVAYGDAGRRLR